MKQYTMDIVDEEHTKLPQQIEVEVWEPHPDKPGILRYVRGRPIQEIEHELLERLGDQVDEYLQSTRRCSSWPHNVRWIACYAVTGGSEGHYIHVDVIHADQSRDMVFLGKTFQGMAHAQHLAALCALYLGA